MGYFKVEKIDVETGKVVEKYEFKNTVLDAGLTYLCQSGNNFNDVPTLAVGTSDVTPDTNQHGILQPVPVVPNGSIYSKAATFTAGTATVQNPQGNKQFTVSASFASGEVIGELTEVSYLMNGTPLNRALFQTPGFLDTRFSLTPELDQIQNSDIAVLYQVYGTHQYSETFTVGPSASNITEIELSFASSGSPAYPLTVQICANNAGVPGAVLGTGTYAAFAEPVQRWRVIKFASAITVVPGTIYHIVVSASSTDLANCYDIYGSSTLQYTNGGLLASIDSGTSYTAISPAANLGFKTYYSTTGALAHTYALTTVQFGRELAQSTDFVVQAFPENNLDSQNTSQGTVRLNLPTAISFGPYTSQIKIYKKDAGGNYNLLASTGTIRQYFYDNGSLSVNTSSHPATSTISVVPPTGLALTYDTANGGPLAIQGGAKGYKVTALQFGLQIPPNSETAGPFVHPGIGAIGATPAPAEFYDSSYSTTTYPISATYWETAASSEVTTTVPTSSGGPFADYFTSTILDPTLWNTTLNNQDYYAVLKPRILGSAENQLQLGPIPGGTPYTISSTRQVRPSQSYYINVQIPWVTNYPYVQLYAPSGTPGYVNPTPICADLIPNKVPIFGFCNPNNTSTFNTDKRLWLEFGLYHDIRDDAAAPDIESEYVQNVAGGKGLLNQRFWAWALYDNVGNVYYFNPGDIKPCHNDGAYAFRIDIATDYTMKIYFYDSNGTPNDLASNCTFNRSGIGARLTSIGGAVAFKGWNTIWNPGHTQYLPYRAAQVVNSGIAGPTSQQFNHFKVPPQYNFAIGNPTSDPLSFVGAASASGGVSGTVNYVSSTDSIITLTGAGLAPVSSGPASGAVVPGICMLNAGYFTPTQAGYGTTLTWNIVPGARKYNVYRTDTPGTYAGNNLLETYETYYPCYAVQSIESVYNGNIINDYQNSLSGVGAGVRNWLEAGVTYATNLGSYYPPAPGEGVFTYPDSAGSYVMGGFVGAQSGGYVTAPAVPNIASNVTGSAEGYLLLLNATGQFCCFTFQGAGFALFAETGPDRGIASLFIDGNYTQDIDFYTGGRHEQTNVFETDVLSAGWHTVYITYTGTKNDYSLGSSIALDYFYITRPAFVDTTVLKTGNPPASTDPNIVTMYSLPVRSATTYNGNGPFILTKDPQHSLSVSLVFSLVNPNL